MGPALVSHSSICLELHTSEAKKKKKQKCDVSMDFAASLDRTGSKFFDLFDADPAQAREEMHRKRQEARERHGDEYVRGLLMSNYHDNFEGKPTI
ncbi:hypothetical protein GN244_ATG11242 [Phytophthora infestans]|uniref:Uncharacterized protein n=1 Tax=Phytophthora infestans TaxID=4787 RepID=A0A833T9J5_PHYIN|nr:hypothetical protein GN244_ATG11242 [Phytophthora infestans]KAF4141065.1 hypothetical protein GN958_ATG09913 [Phytophthora infestans]